MSAGGKEVRDVAGAALCLFGCVGAYGIKIDSRDILQLFNNSSAVSLFSPLYVTLLFYCDIVLNDCQ